MRLALTGAATGIGAEVARKAKEQGHEVIAFDITKPSVAVDRNIRLLRPSIAVVIPTCQRSVVCNADCCGAWVDCLGYGAAAWSHLFHHRHRA